MAVPNYISPARQARLDNGTGPGNEGRGGGGTLTLPNAQAIGKRSAEVPVNLNGQTLQKYFGDQALKNQDQTGNWANPIITAIIAGALTAGAGSAMGGALGGTAGTAGGAAATAGAGGAALGTGGVLTGLGSAVVGAGSGAIGGLASSALSGGNIGKGVLMGAIGGGIGGSAGKLSSSLSNATGLNSSLATGAVKGAIGSGVGAIGAKISGGNVGNAALSGGVGGFLSGAVGSATGSSTLGKVASGLGGMAIAPLLASGGGAHTAGSSGSSYLGAGALGALGSVGGQGNNGNMAGTSTDSTLAGTITGALPGVLQGAAGVYGSQNAAEKMTQADQNAIGTQQSTLGNINNIWSTQQGLGQGAQKALGSALGTNGQPADYSGFENMPGYKFAVSQGTQAIQRQAASMGNAYTPNTAAAVGQYVTGTAAQDYNTYISQLMGAAGLGSTANAGIAAPTYQTGANISQLQQNQGYAQASGVSGASNAVGGIFGAGGVGSSLLGAAGNWLGKQFGGAAPTAAPGSGSKSGVGGLGLGLGGGGRDPFAGTALANNHDAFVNYNMNNGYTGGGDGTFGSGTNDLTGQSWMDPNSLTTPSFDPNSFTMPDMPAIDSGAFSGAGSLDYGSIDSGSATDFLGGGF